MIKDRFDLSDEVFEWLEDYNQFYKKRHGDIMHQRAEIILKDVRRMLQDEIL